MRMEQKANAMASLMCWLGAHVYAGMDECYYCDHQSRKSLERDRDAAYALIRDIGAWSVRGPSASMSLLKNIGERHVKVVRKADAQCLAEGFGQRHESAGS